MGAASAGGAAAAGSSPACGVWGGRWKGSQPCWLGGRGSAWSSGSQWASAWLQAWQRLGQGLRGWVKGQQTVRGSGVQPACLLSRLQQPLLTGLQVSM